LIIVYSALLIGYLAFYYTYLLPNLSSNLITRFDFVSNEWFEADDVKITNNFRTGMATPNDELTYAITYQNKRNETLTIDSQLSVIFGGREVKKVNGSHSLVILPLATNTEEIIFQTEHQGENQVRLTVNIMNSTNTSIIESIPTTINIEVISFADSLQSDLNQYTLIGLLVSSGVAIATIIGLIFSLDSSKKQIKALLDQNQELKKQTEQSGERLEMEKKLFEQTPNLIILWEPKTRPALHTPQLSILLRDLPSSFATSCGQDVAISGIQYRQIDRRHLRVIVENKGEKAAKNCTGIIELVSRPTNCPPFSEEPKTLRWVSPTGELRTSADISPNGGKQALDVAFYDECGYYDMPGMKCTIDPGHPQIRAFAADPVAYKMPWFHIQDGFCLGKFRIKLTIYCENAKPVSQNYEINVTADWQQFMMDEA
jgi:hypothetical protein